MKMKIAALLSLVVLLLSGHYAAAEGLDLSSMADDDLLALRIRINEELASRKAAQEVPEGSTIADLFPDPVLAKCIRDEVGAFSVNDAVTQEKLDTVSTISFTNTDSGIQSLEGIGYLHGMWQLVLHNQNQLQNVPDEIENCISLERFMLSCRSIKTVPDTICNLPLLRVLDLSYTSVSELPADIGNLTTLKELDISHTNITSLPASIYNLTLDKFEREGLDL